MAQWEITRDLVCDGADNGVQGPRGFVAGIGLPHRFRLLDSGGKVYYHGICSEDGVFAPLDDFGMPNAGCTDIQYRNTAGQWEVL